jgi:hypothetical protein
MVSNHNVSVNRFDGFVSQGRNGERADVDALMRALDAGNDLATAKLVDYALSLVDTREGKDQMRHYLFHGTQTQRNYAALYFKRKGVEDILEQAVILGLIDREQAFAK